MMFLTVTIGLEKKDHDFIKDKAYSDPASNGLSGVIEKAIEEYCNRERLKASVNPAGSLPNNPMEINV